MDPLLACLVFLAAAVLDAADVKHKLAVELRDPWQASLWSSIMYAIGTAATWAIVDVSGLLVLPAMAGLVVGTQLALRHAPKS